MVLTIEQQPRRVLAGVAHRGPYHEIGPAFGKLAEILGKHDMWTISGEWLGVYLDDMNITDAGDLRSYAACVIPEDAVLPDGLERFVLEPCSAAIHTHHGPYEGLGQAWQEATAAFLAGDYVASGAPCFERYLNNPAQAAPADLLTEIGLPIRV